MRRYDEKLINLQDKPQWYLDIVPTTLVPAIEWHDANWKADTPGSGELVWESKDILEAIDARFAATPLRSADEEVAEVVEVLNASVAVHKSTSVSRVHPIILILHQVLSRRERGRAGSVER